MTPGENVRRNVEWLMDRRRLSQEAVAMRMRASGFSWHRRTINRLLRGERRLDIDELYALAAALETTVGAVQKPYLAGRDFDDPQGGEFRIGNLEPLSGPDMASLNRMPGSAGDELPEVRVDWHDASSEEPPRWVPWPGGDPFDRVREALAESGWGTEREFLDANPDVQALPFRDLPEYILNHPRPADP